MRYFPFRICLNWAYNQLGTICESILSIYDFSGSCYCYTQYIAEFRFQLLPNNRLFFADEPQIMIEFRNPMYYCDNIMYWPASNRMNVFYHPHYRKGLAVDSKSIFVLFYN